MVESALSKGIIVLAHGSRDPAWALPLQALADQIRLYAPTTQVRCAYLELCPPDLPACTAELVSLGVSSISVVPAFFGMGKHVRADLPQLLQQLQSSYPEVRFTLRRALGEEPSVIAAMAHAALS